MGDSYIHNDDIEIAAIVCVRYEPQTLKMFFYFPILGAYTRMLDACNADIINIERFGAGAGIVEGIIISA